MEWILWDEAMNTGHAGLDEDHRKLVALINRLADGLTHHKGAAFCREAFGQLVEHVQQHFAMEERLMAEHGYLDAERHKAHHATLFEEVRVLSDAIEAIDVGAPPSVSLLDFLEVWLKHHIDGLDRSLAAAIPGS
ncbi:MAG: bacteriohemerythrin [Denitratisoma sp.]|nr:bacteriohemerythrin [Denitratisoma sp.]